VRALFVFHILHLTQTKQQLWPKSTLEGIRSAVTSRKFMSSKPDIAIRFRRTQAHIAASEVVESFELSLARPIGMQIENIRDLDEAERERFGLPSPNSGGADGVVVTDFSSDGSSAASYVKKGDRIVAVESSLGSKMWPVSSAAGVVSAVTSRILGQPVKFRFERCIQVGDYNMSNASLSFASAAEKASTLSSDEATTTVNGGNPTNEYAVANNGSASALSGAVKGYRHLASTMASPSTTTAAATAAPVVDSKVIQSAGSKTHKLLLGRCRDILRTYNSKAREYRANDDISSANRVLSLVADRVLGALSDASAPMDARTLSMIMNTYIAGNLVDKALRTFEIATGLSSNGLPVKVYVNNNDDDTDNKSNIPESPSSTLNVYTATALLKAHASQGNVAAARRILAAMSHQNEQAKSDDIQLLALPWPVRIIPDSQCYNIVLEATSNSLDPKEGLKAAVELFEQMPDSNTQVSAASSLPSKTLVTYNTMLSAFAKQGRSEDAYTVFYSLKFAGFKPDKVTYTSLIKAQVEDGLVEEGIALLAEMAEQHIAADVLTYNTVIKALCLRGKWYEAQNLVAEMEARGISPNSVTYVLLMNGLLKSQRPSTCLTLFETAASDSCTAPLMENVQVYTTAISAASALGDYERAMELVARMQAVGVKPTVQTLTSLMNACLSSGRSDLALQVYTQMQRLVKNSNTSNNNNMKEQVIDGIALTAVLKAMCDSGDYEGAGVLLSQQKDARQEMNGKQVMFAFRYLIHSALENEKYEVARTAFENLLASGYIPSKEFMRIAIVQGMDLTGKHHFASSSSDAGASFAVEEDTQKFGFLLFVLDSIKGRRLPCDTSVYAAVLFEGARLGGSRRLIASLLAKSRSGDVINKTGEHKVRWQQLLNQKSGDIRTMVKEGNARLPSIILRKATDERDVRLLLNAERAVSSQPRRRRVNTMENVMPNGQHYHDYDEDA
jgi:pentatricopeptide repeat protein